MKSHRHILAFLIPVLFTAVHVGSAQIQSTAKRIFDRTEYLMGVQDALRDLKEGIVKYKMIGMPAPYHKDLKRRAKEQFEIEILAIGCCKGPRIDYDNGYDATVHAYLEARYGFDPIEDLDMTLRIKWKEEVMSQARNRGKTDIRNPGALQGADRQRPAK